jgi:hypothetical protein
VVDTGTDSADRRSIVFVARPVPEHSEEMLSVPGRRTLT